MSQKAILSNTPHVPALCSSTHLQSNPVSPSLLFAGFEAAVREANASPAGRRNGGNMLMGVAGEKALLTTLLNRLSALDADALVGHNISAFDLDVLLHRMEKHKVRWSVVSAFCNVMVRQHTSFAGSHANISC